MSKNFSQRRAKHDFDRNRYFTPKHIVEPIRRVMGRIDLDPASEPKANRIVQAEGFYTKEQNGLRQRWYGNVYCNPPYAKGLIDKFVAKAVHEYRRPDSRVDRIAILVNVSGSSAWWHMLLKYGKQYGALMVFLRKRIQFYNPEVAKLIRDGLIDKANSNNAAQALFFFPDHTNYVDGDIDRFKEEFDSLGTVIEFASFN